MIIRALWIIGGVVLAVVTVLAFTRPYEEVNPLPVAVGILIGYLLLMFFWFQSKAVEEKMQVVVEASSASHSGALLEVNKINAGYGRSQILYDVSLEVRENEVVCVIGPNGAGKSTAFKIIMGFINYLGGEITFGGESIVGLRPDQILGVGLGYVPQGRIVFNQMTVRENLEMGAFIERDAQRMNDSMDYVFTLFPRLAERQKQLGGTMSGGEQQMLAMGRALMTRPQMIMIDEPSLGLSPRFVDEVFELIVGLAKSGLTVMVVEQNATRALEIADRGYVLELGRNRYEGTGRELLDNPDVRKMYLGG